MIDEIICKLNLIFIPNEENNYRPKFLDSKILYYYVILLLILKIAIVSPFLFCLPRGLFSADLTKTDLIKLTNATRESLGFQPLKESPVLEEAAYLKAEDMIENDYFAHQSPTGISPWHWFREAGYNYQYAGENLAIGFFESEEVNKAWIDSLSHKRNLLNPNYSEIGIAVLKGDFQGKETSVVVQLFGTPKTVVEKKEKEIPQEKVIPKEEKTPTTIVKEEVATSVAEEVTTSVAIVSTQPNQPKEVLSAFQEPENKNTFAFYFFSFLSSEYYNLLQKIVYGSLALIIISLLITFLFDIFVYQKYAIQYKDIIFKTIGFSALLIILIFLDFDKGTIAQLIPRGFNIY